MNYSKHYTHLLANASNRTLTGYYEVHHIIPRCMGGSNEKSNLIRLIAREHFVAHLLLHKMYPTNRKLVCAVAMMCVGQEERKVTNRLYSWMKEKHSAVMSDLQSQSGNSQWGTKWIYNVELKQSKKIPKTENIPEGWSLGRIVNFNKISKPEVSKKKVQKEQNKIFANELYHLYVDGKYKSIREFCKSKQYDKSHVSLTVMWKKYVPEYAENVIHGKSFIAYEPAR